MYICKICGKSFDKSYSLAAHASHHAKKPPAKANTLKRMKVKKECPKCGTEFEVERTIHKDGTIKISKKEKRFCSRNCANRHSFTEERKRKISKSLKIERTKKYCKSCRIEIKARNKTGYCRFCAPRFRKITPELYIKLSKGGRESVKIQTRRSKNEIYFYELCKNWFNNVKHNEPIFNGWDADVIIEDNKTAILWNGKWHYEKITESHSLEQVQNRDKIKLKEIKKCGWSAYVIKDMGKYSPKFVEEKFNEFIRCRVV